jgi:hypothetical protein
VLTVTDNVPASLPRSGTLFEPFFTKKHWVAAYGWADDRLEHHAGPRGLVDVRTGEGERFFLIFPACARRGEQPKRCPGGLAGKSQKSCGGRQKSTKNRLCLLTKLDRGDAVSSARSGNLRANEAGRSVDLDMIMDPGIGGRETMKRYRLSAGQRAVIATVTR